ncbi:MAG: hypothetical protein DRQ55_00670 [Planctomycetota bacterium]|nr:MAG: hypothetical protein DRQ55_00670 [Planctomycetota bacterium]
MGKALPAGVPDDLSLASVLSETDRGQVLEVQRGDCRLVLRIEQGGGSLAAGVLAALQAPGFVPPLESGLTDDGRPWALRVFVPGRPLDQAVDGEQVSQVASWLTSLLESLATLHEAGFVHRDIKASNVIVGSDGPMLVDLDLASWAGAGAGATGSRGHIAPEVLLGHPCTPASDLFAVGAMLAFAFCGAPDPGFDHHFPQQAFWEAAGLDSAAIPVEFGALVRQLVRRHPGDRPFDARSAAARLGDGNGSLPPRRLSFVGGRDTALRRLLSALDPGAGGRHVVLVTVADPEERVELLDTLHLGLAMGGQRVLREHFADPLDQAIDRVAGSDADCVLLAATDGAAGSAARLAELVVAYGGAESRPRGVLALVLEEDLAARVSERLRGRELAEDAAPVRHHPWPRVPVVALSRHLDRLSGGAAPEVARRLASSLHRLTIGRRSDIDRALGHALDAGVMRPDPPRYTLLRDEWPAEAAGFGDDVAASCARLPSAARALLAGLHACSWSPSLPELITVLAGEPPDLAASLESLQASAVVRRPLGPWGPVEVLDRRWTAASSAALDADAQRTLSERALVACGDTPQRQDVRARQLLSLAQSADDLAPVLDAAGALLEHGRLGAARALVQGAAALAEADVEDRRRLLEARVELAQGAADRALAALVARWGEALQDADGATLQVAAHAAELCGRRELGRALNERLLANPPDRTTLLRATVGLAYALLLDGDLDGAAARVAVALQPDDDDSAAAGVLNLTAIIDTRQGREAQASAGYGRALERARAAGDPLLAARIELNRAHHDRRHGRTAEAVAALERSGAAFADAGNVQGRALALNNLGVLQRDLGELKTCRARLREALGLRRRVGDAHGAASSLGSLAAAELEAGHVGVALELVGQARRAFAKGGHARELAFLDVQESMALALAGRHREAAERLDEQRLDALRAESPVLVGRAEAMLQLLGNDRAAAGTTLDAALTHARVQGDAAESFRCAALLCSVRPRDPEALAALSEAAQALDSPVRVAEAAWRAASDDELDQADQLSAWLELFEQAGRTDLAAAVALRLAQALDAAGDRAGRRVARARAGQAGDALSDGLLPVEREACLERISRLSGPRPSALTRHRSLGVDWLLSCNRRMATESDLEGLLLAIVDMALELTGSRRGFLVLTQEEQAEVHVARNFELRDMPPDEVRFSRTVVSQAVAKGLPVLTTDAGADERFAGVQSVSNLALRSVLCVPLPGVDGGGALYLDDDQRLAAFDETDVERVAALADQAALAINQLRRQREIVALNARLSQRVAFAEQELVQARTALRQRGEIAPVSGMVGEAECMREVFELVARVAPTSLSVLVTGPSGAGKDLVARALHERSDRADGPLIIENVAAVPANLLESEMFGHARGAFTGADRERHGLFAEADGGTFVLDEIGELPLELQPKLLRVLETGEYRPVGSRRVQQVDVRIVAATNCDLLECVREGSFREDLYYRLNAVEICLPGLDQRLSDVPLLVQHALHELNRKHGTDKLITEDVLASFTRRSWPGQVRELLNEVSRVYFLSDEQLNRPQLVRAAAQSRDNDFDPMPRSLKLEDVERAAIERALRAADGRKEQAARLLGISRAGLYAKIRRLEIETG